MKAVFKIPYEKHLEKDTYTHVIRKVNGSNLTQKGKNILSKTW